MSSYFSIRALVRAAEKCTRSISNKKLQAAVEKTQISIFVSQKTHVPFATFSSVIVLPKKIIDLLTQEEFEAILAHELEHLRYKDPLIKTACSLLASLFWWIPTGWWLKKIESDQENSCDEGIATYQIKNTDLASSIIKVIKQAKTNQTPLLACSFAKKKSFYLKRMENILNFKGHVKVPLLTLATLSFLFILSFCSIWAC